MKKLTIFISLFMFYFAFSQNQDEVFNKYIEKDLENKYTEIQYLLSNSLLDYECGGTSDKLKKKNCSFQELCDVLINNNDNPYLYTNSRGERIPNFRMQKIIENTKHCYQDIKTKHTKTSISMDSAQIARKNIISKVNKEGIAEQFIEYEKKINQEEIDPKSFKQIKDKAGNIVDTNNIPEQIKVEYTKSLAELNKRKKSYDDWLSFKTNKSKEEMVGVFTRVQSGIIEILKDKQENKPEDTLAYEKMIKRVSTIQFNLDAQNHPHCTRPTAFYRSTSHSFTLCPQITAMPINAVMTVIAHELGHSIDPCILSFDLVKLNNQYMVNYSRKISDEKDLVSGNIKLTQNPLLQVVKCLNQKESLGASGFNKPDAFYEVQEKMKTTLKSSKSYQLLASQMNRIKKDVESHGACTSVDESSQLQEAFSDWLSAEFIGREVKLEKGSNKLVRAFEAGAPLLGRSCARPIGELTKIAAEFIVEMNCYKPEGMEATVENYLKSISGSIEGLEDEHNHDRDRLDKVYASHPEVAKALGCNQNKMARYCNE